jgi:hypothetical protein
MLQAKFNKRCFLILNKKSANLIYPQDYLKIKKFSFSSQENPKKENESKGLMGKIRKFGKFGIIFYTAYVAAGFLGFFLLLQYKFLKVEKVIDKFEEKGLNEYIDIRKKLKDVDPKYVNLLAAYILNQVFEIVRFPTTILILTYIFRKKK